MRISKLLNKSYLSILFCFLFLQNTELYSNEPVDIWSLENQKDLEEKSLNEVAQDENKSEKTLYELQGEKNINSTIELDSQLQSDQIEIVGIYDPSENDITIDMWKNSDGNKILDLYRKIQKIDLSHDSKEILKISLLTNSYVPTKNISNDQFLKLKRDWLLENSDLDLIEKYLIKNQKIKNNEKLIKFLINEYLSKSELGKSCKVLSKINYPTEDEYLTKFNIYCLINNNKKDEAQLQYDLKRELGFKDDFFEKKFNYLMGYSDELQNEISDKNILEFHLSHRTISDFKYKPNQNTPKIIWKYLSSANLFEKVDDIDLENQDEILLIEKAVHEKNYNEKDLLELYKRFKFNINQLINVQESYKLLSPSQGRALLYQRLLLSSDINQILNLSSKLKNSFTEENLGGAFSDELLKILEKIDEDKVPSNYSSFYNANFKNKKVFKKNIKINNKVIHQSKLLRYFEDEYELQKIEKETNDIIKKIKKNKDYFVSTKDLIILESLISDGVKILKKYSNLFEFNQSEIPTDIQLLINNNELGLVLLRLTEIIGEDDLEDLGPDTIYFIISTLNQLNIDPLRNQILLKVLPLKI